MQACLKLRDREGRSHRTLEAVGGIGASQLALSTLNGHGIGGGGMKAQSKARVLLLLLLLPQETATAEGAIASGSCLPG